MDSTAHHFTDAGNAERLVATYGPDLRYCRTVGWLMWDGKRWKVDEDERIMLMAKKTARKLQAEALKCQDEKRRAEMVGFGLRSESKYALTAMVDLARSEEGIPIAAEALDADPWTLTVQNGTLDLRTGTLQPHRREDLITKMAAVTYDPAATCPTWLKFLDRIMGGDQELVNYLQRIVGYCLTGTTGEKAFFLLHGDGDNGKSTFINALGSLLGDYKMTVQTETLLLKKGDTPGNDIARLRAARLVSAVETKGGKRLNEALAKQLTGGDPIAVRFLYKEFFEYTPTFKVLLAVNHLPIIGDTGYAMWERVKLVPFKVVIPKVEQDKALKDKLRAELAGILRWAVQGCLAWQEHGLGEPAAVGAATAAYRSDMDTVAQFLKDCCVRDPKAVVSFADVYDAYTKWEEGYPLGPKAFNTRLRRLGIKEGARLNAARRWIGLRVTDVTDVTQNPGSSTVPAIGENAENLVTTVTIEDLKLIPCPEVE